MEGLVLLPGDGHSFCGKDCDRFFIKLNDYNVSTLKHLSNHKVTHVSVILKLVF